MHRSNGFDLIRLAAATMVLVGHTFALNHGIAPRFLDNAISTLGVKIFFVTSGFLVTKSWLADPSPVRFGLRRLLRIMPGLAGVVVVTVLVLGPLLTVHPWPAYWSSSQTWRYLWNLALYPIYALPGVFTDNPYPSAVNGSLWSLPVEVLMYALLPLILGAGRVRARLLLPAVAFASSAAAIYFVRLTPGSVSAVVYGTPISSLMEVSCYFAIGSVWAVFGWQRFARRPLVAVALLVLAALITPHASSPVVYPAISEMSVMVALPFVVISFGVQRFAWYDKPALLGDMSYGIYLYGFPVQQAVLALSLGQLGAFHFLAIALPVTVICAVFSWFCIERSALSLKPRRGAGRGQGRAGASLLVTVGSEERSIIAPRSSRENLIHSGHNMEPSSQTSHNLAVGWMEVGGTGHSP